MKYSFVASVGMMGGLFGGFVRGHPHNLKRAVVTEVVFTTVHVANVIVWVDYNGVPYATTTVNLGPMPASSTAESSLAQAGVVDEPVLSTPTVEPVPFISSTAEPESIISITEASSVVSSSTSSSSSETSAPDSAPPPAPSSNTPAVVTPEAPAPLTEAPATSSAVAMLSPEPEPEPLRVDGDSFPIGITYDPFKPGACKTEEEMRNEWGGLKKYGVVRIYGMGCNIIPNAVRLAAENNQRIFAGIWMSNGSDAEDPDEVIRTLQNAVDEYNNGNWDIIAMVSVENERVNGRTHTASEVVDQINRVRQSMRSLGYNGPVGAVETVPAMVDNPAICEASDIAMVNVHAFFDMNSAAEESGTFTQGQVQMVRDACNKRVVVCEAGWPHQGDSNGEAIPSPENQRKALDSLLSKFDKDLFLFNAYDSPWKSDWAGSFNAERWWGIM